jgi:hypothetical protein
MEQHGSGGGLRHAADAVLIRRLDGHLQRMAGHTSSGQILLQICWTPQQPHAENRLPRYPCPNTCLLIAYGNLH